MMPGELATVLLTERDMTQALSPLARKQSPLSSDHIDVICSPDHSQRTVEIQVNVSRRTWASPVTQW